MLSLSKYETELGFSPVATDRESRKGCEAQGESEGCKAQVSSYEVNAIVQRATSKANEQRNNSNMVCEPMEQREPYLSLLKYGRVVTEEDDSQDITPYGIKPEEQCTEEEYLTYCNEDDFLQSPEY